MSLATNYREDISLAPISLFVPCFLLSRTFRFTSQKKRRNEERSRRRRENIFIDINLFSPFFRDWKANAEEAFELWIGSLPTSILSNSYPLQPSPLPCRKSCFLWKETASLEFFPPFDRHHLLISFPRPSRPETHIRLSMERFLPTSEQNCFRSERLRCF